MNLNKTKEQVEKELFDMIYSWGRVGIVVNEKSPAFIEKLDQLTEIKYKKELKISDDRFRKAEQKLQDYEK